MTAVVSPVHSEPSLASFAVAARVLTLDRVRVTVAPPVDRMVRVFGYPPFAYVTINGSWPEVNPELSNSVTLNSW